MMGAPVHFVINPAGASGRTLKEWQKLERKLFTEHRDFLEHYSTRSESIEDIVRDLSSTADEISIVIVGGDGSMNEAVNGILNFDTVKLGMIPCGSGNDLAKALQLSEDTDELVEMVFDGSVKREQDVGRVKFHTVSERMNSEGFEPFEDENIIRRFNISAGIGFDAEICAAAALSPRKLTLNQMHMGKLIYIEEAIRIVKQQQRFHLTCRQDNVEKKYEECLLAVAMNTKYEGGGFMFCPEADGDDGMLDFCVGDHLSTLDFYKIFPYAYSGAHVKFEGIETGRADRLELQTDTPMTVHTDGEVHYRSNHITIQLEEKKLRMLV